VQHLPHLQYDQTYEAYRRVSAMPFSTFHSDLEILDKTAASATTINTWGQYRLFRLSTLAAIAKRRWHARNARWLARIH
jgi:hypothetical protein